MTIPDHILVFALIAVMPLAGVLSFQRLLRHVDAGEPMNRSELYQANIWTAWILFVATGILWANAERSWAALGFGFQADVWFLVALALTIAGIVVLLLQLRKVRTASAGEISKLRAELGRLESILPQNGNELGVFYWLSITAGIVEETLWRGFLLWYLSAFVPVWIAALIGIVGFGIAHAYQGISQIPKITLVGAAFTALFFLSGSLWLPMLLHAAVDILQGRAGYEIVRRDTRNNGNSAGNARQTANGDFAALE